MKYRKKRGSDTWHWCTNCRDWPGDNEDYDEVDLPPGQRPSSGEARRRVPREGASRRVHD
jgi:hypothetical protein